MELFSSLWKSLTSDETDHSVLPTRKRTKVHGAAHPPWYEAPASTSGGVGSASDTSAKTSASEASSAPGSGQGSHSFAAAMAASSKLKTGSPSSTAIHDSISMLSAASVRHSGDTTGRTPSGSSSGLSTPVTHPSGAESSTSLSWSRMTSKEQWKVKKAENKRRMLKRAMEESAVLDSRQFSSGCWTGIPPSIRAETWRILLSYAPKTRSRRQSTLETKRRRYRELCKLYYTDVVSHEHSIIHQILLDIPRTSPNLRFFQHEKVATLMTRALYIWSHHHTATGYVQGFNDLITPFVFVFLDEVLRTHGLTLYQQSELNGDLSGGDLISLKYYASSMGVSIPSSDSGEVMIESEDTADMIITPKSESVKRKKQRDSPLTSAKRSPMKKSSSTLVTSSMSAEEKRRAESGETMPMPGTPQTEPSEQDEDEEEDKTAVWVDPRPVDCVYRGIDCLSEAELMNVEADCCWCLEEFLESLQINYTHEQPGLKRMVEKLECLCEVVEGLPTSSSAAATSSEGGSTSASSSTTVGGSSSSASSSSSSASTTTASGSSAKVGSAVGERRLVDHLRSFNPPIEFINFSFRWMNCFLMREFSLVQIIRLWDTYLAEFALKKDNVTEFHIFVCLALLFHFKSDLMDKDFGDCLIFIQNLPTQDWNEDDLAMLLSLAYEKRLQYEAVSARVS